MNLNPETYAAQKVKALSDALIEKYRKSPIDFFTQQLKIKTKKNQLIPFILNKMQIRIMSYVLHCIKKRKPIRLIVLKGRQLGLSTLTEALLFWKCALNPYTSGITMAHDIATSVGIFKMAKTFYDNMHPAIRPIRKYSSKKELVFERPEKMKKGESGGYAGMEPISLSSQIIIQTARNVHSGAGSTLHFLHLSEIARFPYPEEIKTSILPTVPFEPGTFIVMESTAHWSTQWMKDEWDLATAGDSGFYPIFISWTDAPEYSIPLERGEVLDLDPEEEELFDQGILTMPQLKWRKKTITTLGDINLFRQEYPLTPEEAFITVGQRVFDPKITAQLRETITIPKYIGEIAGGKFIAHYENHNELPNFISLWELPKTGLQYDIGVDVSLGNEGGDYSAIICIERESKRVAAAFKGLVDPFDLADLCARIGNFYNIAQIAVEINSMGLATNAKLAENYQNTYRWKLRDESVLKITKKTGWETSHKTKKYLVGLTRTYLRQKVLIRSRLLYDELCLYIDYGDDRFGAAPGTDSHDDMIMAYMIALIAADDEKGFSYQEIDSKDPKLLVDPAYHDTEWNPGYEEEKLSFMDL